MTPHRDVYHSAQAVSLADRSPEAEVLWTAIQDTLRRNRFRLDRVDRRAGVITTMPVVSQHFFEFWRHDVDTWSDLWESTINPIRRRVEARVSRDASGAWTELTMSVRKQRFSSPDRQFNNTAAVYEFFGTSLPSTTGAVVVTAEQDVWVDAGVDPAMEDYLLHLILDRAGMASPSIER